MIIGTVRTEEARIYDSHAGFHQFHAEESQEPYGSFEVFWQDDNRCGPDCDEPGIYGHGNHYAAGWYWQAGFPGCLPDGEPNGPFASSQQAHENADEWAPEYDE